LKIILFVILLASFSCSSLKDSVKSSIQKTVNKTLDHLDAPIKKDRPFYMAWSKNLDPIYNTGNLPVGTGSPFIHEDHLYMGTLSGEMNAYDLETGKIVWSHKESEAINTMAHSFEDTVIYGTMSGRLYARHFLTGDLSYAIDMGSPIESRPVLSKGRLYIHLRNHKIVALDAKTGKIIWGYKRSVPFTTTLNRSSTVLPLGNKLIVGFADGNLIALTRDEGVVVWEQKISNGLKFVDVDASPIYFNGFIVAGAANDKLRFIDPKNGIIKRTIDIVIGHAPIIIKDELVVGSIHGSIYKIDKNGKVVQRNKITKFGISSIVSWRNGYAVSTMGGDLYHVTRDFKRNSIFKLGHDQSAIFGFLQQNKDYLATYSSRNRLYVFKNVK
jgi:outer membrane protein assembly factor BamB